MCAFYVYFCVRKCVWIFCVHGLGFFNGNCTKDKNSIKQIFACVVCYSGSKYGTYFLITRVYCGIRL